MIVSTASSSSSSTAASDRRFSTNSRRRARNAAEGHHVDLFAVRTDDSDFLTHDRVNAFPDGNLWAERRLLAGSPSSVGASSVSPPTPPDGFGRRLLAAFWGRIFSGTV